MKSIIFWDITQYSPLSVNRRFGGTYRLHLQGQRNAFSKEPASNCLPPACHLLARWFLAEIISLTLEMEAISSSETSVGTQRTTRHYIVEDGTLHIYTFIRNTRLYYFAFNSLNMLLIDEDIDKHYGY
jgi:hypothetical protein